MELKNVKYSVHVVGDKVGTDMLEVPITAFEDKLQSVAVAALNKIKNPSWITALK